MSFLIEDSWRSYWSSDPLAPSFRGGKPYPVGKQARAYAASSTVVDLVRAVWSLADLQAATARKVERERQAASDLAARRLRAAHAPLAVIAPQSSLPGFERTVEELEKRCRLPIEEIRGCFRQGRRSAEQRLVRDRVETAIRAMVKHYRMVHPVLENKDRYGLKQWKEARSTWREFVGQDIATSNNRTIAYDVFGEWENANGDLCPVEYDLDRRDNPKNYVPRRRSPRDSNAKKPQIVPRLADVLGVAPRTVQRILESSDSGSKRVETGFVSSGVVPRA